MASVGRKLLVVSIAALCVIGSMASFAEEPAGVAFRTDLNFVAATTFEMKAKLIESVRIPFLAGDGPLFAGNNVTFKGIAGCSPVSVTGHVQAVWTPIAFFQLYAEAGGGTGWNIPIAVGLAANNPTGTLSTAVDRSFGGCVWSAKGGATVQFDFAALSPGDWHHVVVSSSHELRYRAFTGAAAGEPWYFEADEGENRNGWNYFGNLFVGYQMPLFVDTAGFYGEVESYRYDAPGGSVWGDSLPRFVFGPLLNFKVSDQLSIALLAQMRTRRNYTSGNDKTYFAYRVLDQGNPLRIECYRIAINVTYRIR